MSPYILWAAGAAAVLFILRFRKIRNLLIVFLVFFLVWYGIMQRKRELLLHTYNFDYSELEIKEDTAMVEINGGIPFFTEEEMSLPEGESYGDMDFSGRCSAAFAVIGPDMMPEAEREDISEIRPSGWQGVRFDDLPLDGFLYHRCHLIAFELTGENANEKNLITGTVFMNMNMTAYENLAASYIRRTGNHVVYRSTPVFLEDEQLARGVLLEGRSQEDDEICFCVFFPNIQPGYRISYDTGKASRG